jgi:hypothetical protein
VSERGGSQSVSLDLATIEIKMTLTFSSSRTFTRTERTSRTTDFVLNVTNSL